MNKVLLVGNIGKMYELKNAETQQAVQVFSLATSENYLDKKSGDFKSVTEWHRVVGFGKLAEFASRQLVGNLVEIEGQNRTREYTKDGVKHTVTEVVLKAPPKTLVKRGTSEDTPSSEKPATSPEATADFDDDIPF